MITKNAKNILLADDSIFFRTRLSTILTEAGHQVTLATDGRETIKRLREDPDATDLLILDLQMPHIDGFGVLEWMKQNGYIGRVPVLAITGVYGPEEVVGRLKSLGASGFMTKGFSPEEIIYRINRLLFPDKADEGVEPRVPIAVPVDYTFDDTTYTGFLLNISATGLFLHTMVGLLPGTLLRLRFSLPAPDRVFEIEGIVTRSTTSSANKSLFIGVGVRFTSIKDEDGEELKRFIDNEVKRRSLDW